MKIGFVVTMHWSDKLRPNGKNYIINFIESTINSLNYDFTIYVIDNESEHRIDFSNYKNVKYTRIDDQSIKGITGAWNRGIYLAYLDNCDIIINCNDDLTINTTINDFIKEISNDEDSLNIVYGPLSNGILSGPQQSDEIKKGISYTDVLNGFLFGMTKQHYEKYRYKENTYFNKDNKHNGGDGKWGGQEGQFLENTERGLKCKIINFCWIAHKKERGWKNAKGYYK